jgi:exosortase
VIRGLLVCAGGRAWAAAFNFPLLFLFFMFPLPVTWTGYAALLLQDMVSRVSETVLSLFVVCHRVGHTIRIAGVDQSLVVAEECSGLGQIVSFLAFAALLGHLLARPAWHRLALLVGAVPVAVIANTLRVVLMNLAAAYFGTKWMGGTLHDAPALFSLPVGIALFLLFDRVLSGLAAPAADAPPGTENAGGGIAPAPTPAAGEPVSGRGLVLAAVLLAVAVAGQFALAAHVRSAGEVSFPTLARPLDSLPLAFNDPATGEPVWTGANLPEGRAAILAQLPFRADDILVRGYRDARTGATVQLYMVHSRAGEDREHHPEICIRDVSGAPEDLSFRRRIPLRPDGRDEAQRFRFQTGVGRSVVVYYWHYTLVPAPNPSQTRLQTLHQRIGVAAPSLTVQVSMSTAEPRALASVEQHLLPALDAAARVAILPAGATAGCNRVPIALARH